MTSFHSTAVGGKCAKTNEAIATQSPAPRRPNSAADAGVPECKGGDDQPHAQYQGCPAGPSRASHRSRQQDVCQRCSPRSWTAATRPPPSTDHESSREFAQHTRKGSLPMRADERRIRREAHDVRRSEHISPSTSDISRAQRERVYAPLESRESRGFWRQRRMNNR